MERKRFRVGSIAVLFTVVVLCVAIFSTLTVVTAVTDVRVAQRYGSHIRELYDCENLGQEWLARADGYLAGECPLPEGSWETGSELGTQIENGSIQLTIRLEKTETGFRVTGRNCSARWEPETGENLW